MRNLAIALGAFCLSVAAVPAVVAAAEEAHPLVHSQAGGLPILIAAPHGGEQAIAGAAPRQRGVTLRDSGTLELAQALSDRLERELGARPYLVAARFHRRFADANRAEGEALESAAAKPPYEHYHRQLRAFVDELRARFPGGALLIDLHGQSDEPAVVHRGTQNGATVAALLQRRGPSALIGPESLFGALERAGVRVFPPAGAPVGQPREDKRFAGGHTVQTYGSGREGGIDAIQVEVGRDLRSDASFVAAFAGAIATFQRAHLSPVGARAPATAPAGKPP